MSTSSCGHRIGGRPCPWGPRPTGSVMLARFTRRWLRIHARGRDLFTGLTPSDEASLRTSGTPPGNSVVTLTEPIPEGPRRCDASDVRARPEARQPKAGSARHQVQYRSRGRHAAVESGKDSSQGIRPTDVPGDDNEEHFAAVAGGHAPYRDTRKNLSKHKRRRRANTCARDLGRGDSALGDDDVDVR